MENGRAVEKNAPVSAFRRVSVPGFVISCVPLNSALVESPALVARSRSVSPTTVLLFATLGLLWFILCRDLSLEWSSNEQYSYGWFVPFFAVFLFWLRWEDAQPHLRGSRLSVNGRLIAIGAIVALALIAPIRLFEVANPDWRPLSWVHALTVVGLTLLVLGYGGGRSAVRHFAFPVCFILVAVPWLTPIEAPLVQSLMRIVAAFATETLTLFGIPAQLEGSLIRVSTGVVGVNEACSGVRSLQTSLMIGLLFGELKRLTIARRFLLVGAALAIALCANFGRALFLVWIAATQNLAAVERWHDLAGYAIVGAVFLGTIALASALANLEGRALSRPSLRPDGEGKPPARPSLAPLGNFKAILIAVLAWLLFVEAGVAGWYRWHERRLVPGRAWTVQWTENAAGFKEVPIDAHTRETLRYDEGREAIWSFAPFVREDSAPVDRAAVAYLFFFRWEPGTATVLRARAHRPDICLPAAGWAQAGAPETRSYPVGDGFALPFQHLSFVRESPGSRPFYAETFFCLREDRVRPDEQGAPDDRTPFSHWSIPERWEVVRKGLRNPGQQVMEFILLTRHRLSAAEAEAEFGHLAPKLVRVSKKEEGGSKK